MVGTGASALSSVLGKALSETGRGADRLKLSAYGIGSADIAKQLKSLNAMGVQIDDASQIPIINTLKESEALGLINAGDDIVKNASNVKDYYTKIAKNEIDPLISRADKFVAPDKNFNFDKTLNYIDTLSGSKRASGKDRITRARRSREPTRQIGGHAFFSSKGKDRIKLFGQGRSKYRRRGCRCD